MTDEKHYIDKSLLKKGHQPSLNKPVWNGHQPSTMETTPPPPPPPPNKGSAGKK